MGVVVRVGLDVGVALANDVGVGTTTGTVAVGAGDSVGVGWTGVVAGKAASSGTVFPSTATDGSQYSTNRPSPNYHQTSGG